MQKANKKIFPILVITVAIVALLITPALAKDSQKKKSSHSSAKAAEQPVTSLNKAMRQKPASMMRSRARPGRPSVEQLKRSRATSTPWKTTKVIKSSCTSGKARNTSGKKKVGDTVRAEITRGGFANSIQ